MPFFFPEVGPLTFIAPGATQTWEYGWPDLSDQGLVIAGPNLNRIGSFGGEIIAFDQGKQAQLNEPGRGTHYFVSIKNTGPTGVLYNLQVGGFK